MIDINQFAWTFTSMLMYKAFQADEIKGRHVILQALLPCSLGNEES
jgi:hypothetical protein